MTYSAVRAGAASLNASSQIVKVLGLPGVREALGREGYEPIGDTPEQFAALIKSEVARYSTLVKSAGIPPQ